MYHYLKEKSFLVAGLRGHPLLRTLLACAAIALSTIGVCACGSARKTAISARAARSGASRAGTVTARTRSNTVQSAGLPKRDGDSDVDGFAKNPYDGDHDAIPIFGRPAGAADRQAVTALVGRYYAFAAAGDGGRACSMLYAVMAERFVEEHRRGKGPASLQGDTCAQILSKLFKQRHRELREDIATYRVLVVQVRGNRGIALVRFGAPAKMEEFEVLVHREGGSWRIVVPFDQEAV